MTTNGTTKILTLNLGGYVTSTALTNALAAYTDTTALTIFLGAKQNTLTAGTGIAISGATISSTHTPIILQLDGTTQSGATTLNFVGNNASFASNVLNISRMAWQDALTLQYSNSASHKNLAQGNYSGSWRRVSSNQRSSTSYGFWVQHTHHRLALETFNRNRGNGHPGCSIRC